ncbi:MAG: tyrosine-type recombinase/integrase [Gammaproteobacteria bacterium]|nr:tyrosine-type recombinase/integrase [Gammaproteobacteria bacterium]MDZ7752566.1 tyrosine-type recombinase/integrase [Gammaproteobacteria bacterium]MDZ7753335.1 tyrosine-type recombinase/integrase [Gammaproteobacteria bacterium]
MNQLRDALEEYLAVRRSLGFGLRIPASLLHNFVSFLEANEATYITRALAIRWAEQPRDAQLATWAGRLGVVRRFARWRSVTDPRTEIPPDGLLPYRYHRNPPYIYTDEEIERLLGAAAGLPSANGLKARSYLTLFGLLSVTGMRVSEALMLDRVDVDLEQGILTIRRTKFGKSRLVPVHRSTRDALESYDTQRTRVFPRPETPAFFLSERGRRITEWSARYTFAKLSQRIGLRGAAKGHGRGPRIHDMRHRFAARTLLQWYRAGVDVEHELPKLATYLGHVHVNETYWYLEAVPELLQLATKRLMEKAEEVRS